MSTVAGTYAIVLRCDRHLTATYGRHGMLVMHPGYYVYIGSAFGPGGIRARVSRHWRTKKRKHWHIDYLGEHTQPHAAWFSIHPEKLEHHWAEMVSALPGMIPVTGFGCSDCNCDAHLFYCVLEPVFEVYAKALPGHLQRWEEADCTWPALGLDR